jgi:RNA polymerase sigma factor (sigma-70 family)
LALQQDRLYAEFGPLVRRLIRQYGENAEIRNDLEGEIYYRFCVLLKAYDPNRGVPLRPYLVRQLSASVYAFARHHWRNHNREVSLELFTSDGGPKQSVDPTPDWDDALDLQQFKNSLPAVIARLSERQRLVLIWRYYEDRSFEEIAERLGIQTATARSLLRHALNHLREDILPLYAYNKRCMALDPKE